MNLAVTHVIDINYEPDPGFECVHDWAQRYHHRSKTSARNWRKTRRLGVRALHVAGDKTYRIGKRAFDIVFAAALLIIFGPVLLLVAAAVKLTDGGPVLFWQKRVGMWGEVFDFPKFRSMVVDAEKILETVAAHNHHGESITFKIKRDPRVTPIGRLIRRFSLDEFPQLWCVLRGEMSLVGPRPALPRETSKYTPEHRRRLDVRPGLTCIWQVNGRANVPFDRQLQMDVEYVESHNFWLDLRLVASTVPAVITGRGAY